MKTIIKKEFTVTHRILHWSLGLLMTVLFITGFLRMQWMGRKPIVAVIEQDAPGVMTKEQTMAIVNDILSPMWQWHEYTAYIIVFVFLMRFAYILMKGTRFPNPFIGTQSIKARLQGMIYILFYWFIVIAAITGFYLKWGDGDLKKPMETVHKLAIYWFPIFILVHFAGIVIAELTFKKGITSKMIGGD
ncbi:cytochrome b/b6 domain-containing protein [Pedobacter sp.]